MKIKKKNIYIFFLGGMSGGVGLGVSLWGQGGCGLRSEVFVKIWLDFQSL